MKCQKCDHEIEEHEWRGAYYWRHAMTGSTFCPFVMASPGLCTCNGTSHTFSYALGCLTNRGAK